MTVSSGAIEARAPCCRNRHSHRHPAAHDEDLCKMAVEEDTDVDLLVVCSQLQCVRNKLAIFTITALYH